MITWLQIAQLRGIEGGHRGVATRTRARRGSRWRAPTGALLRSGTSWARLEDWRHKLEAQSPPRSPARPVVAKCVSMAQDWPCTHSMANSDDHHATDRAIVPLSWPFPSHVICASNTHSTKLGADRHHIGSSQLVHLTVRQSPLKPPPEPCFSSSESVC